MPSTESEVSASPLAPFYERIARRLAKSCVVCCVLDHAVTGRVATASILLLVTWATVGPEQFWRPDTLALALLIVTAMVTLHYATHVLDVTLRRLAAVTKESGPRARALIDAYLTDSRMLAAGFGFGVLNTLLGYWFGVPDGRERLYGAFFVAGFVCGLAFFGILGIVKMFAHYTERTDLTVDFKAPDRCGGLRFVGDALVVFASVTLLVGVMISYVITAVGWTRGDRIVTVTKLAWILFPYAAAAGVLLLPARQVAVVIAANRLHLDEQLQQRIAAAQTMATDALNESPPNFTVHKDLSELIQRLEQERAHLYGVRSLPFAFSARLKFSAPLAISLLITASTLLRERSTASSQQAMEPVVTLLQQILDLLE